MTPDRGTSRSSTRPAATVLVVEDRREVRELVMRTLAEQGYAITIATTGPDAVEAALAEQPDLMVLDLGLPGMDGIDVIRTLRERRFLTPILVLTARGGVGERVRALDAGADDYLPRPFDVEELSARARALLRRGRGGERLVMADLACDTVTREVRRDGEPILL